MATIEDMLGKPYSAAQELATSGKYAEAVAAFTVAISLGENDARCRVGRGLANQHLGNHSGALVDFDHVISSHPTWTGAFTAYYSRAISRQALGRSRDAISDCDEAIKRNSLLPDAYYLRSTLHAALGEVEAAQNDIDCALQIAPNFQDAHFMRGSLCYIQGQYESAVAAFTRAIQNSSGVGVPIQECFFRRGLAFQQFGKHVVAILDFTKAIEADFNNSGSYLRRSWSYHMIGKYELAEADMKTANELLNSKI